MWFSHVPGGVFVRLPALVELVIGSVGAENPVVLGGYSQRGATVTAAEVVDHTVAVRADVAIYHVAELTGKLCLHGIAEVAACQVTVSQDIEKDIFLCVFDGFRSIFEIVGQLSGVSAVGAVECRVFVDLG